MNSIFFTLVSVTLVVFIVQWIYIHIINKYFHMIPASYPEQEKSPEVTVLIPFLHGYKAEKDQLDQVLTQKYENYSVFVLNDGLKEFDKEELEGKKARYPHLSYLSVAQAGKKQVINHAISELEPEIILGTDADCSPVSAHWIKKMLSAYQAGSIVIGYSPYREERGMLNRWIRYETAFTALQYMAMARAGRPYMAVGRNILYEKKTFDLLNGFQSHLAMPSGDDDLFIRDAVKAGIPIIPHLDKDTFVYSEAEKTVGKYFNQKARHMTTADSYSLLSKVLLSIFPASQLLFYLGTLSLTALFLFYPFPLSYIVIILLMLLAKWLLLRIYLAVTFKKLNVADLIPFIPLLDVLATIYYLVMSPTLIFKKKKW